MIYSDIHISEHKNTKTSVNKLYLWSIWKCSATFGAVQCPLDFITYTQIAKHTCFISK